MSTPEEIQAEIEQQREQLAETVDQLTHKLDVKSQTKAKVGEVKSQTKAKVDEAKLQTKAKVDEAKLQTKAKVHEVKDLSTTDEGKPRPELLGAAAAVVVVGVALIIWLRQRR
jgi:capsular polysaccharide biosynthesis protein